MNEHKTIPFYILLIRTLAKDFEEKEMTWRELYDILFIEGTDIYREFVVTLVDSGIILDSRINYKETVKITNGYVVMFHEYKEERILMNMENHEEFKIPKSATLNTTLAKLGFVKVKEKKNNE
ncbi:hypothetical protein [Mycoplasma todarodis]|uniref:Uncharacterized protein n=1 Tax=Mycoplasma todarodis TaxID=1937191 RepID=A0A4R0XM18_9MOLU|nr:hypothetical protein [Mycoplasma todarodis]TCG11564.1 hypothetical protein C4B25_01120 [Mycoplasma todarodis]